MKVLVIQNHAVEGIGLYARYMVEREIDHVILHAYRNEPFPADEDFDAVVIGGTPARVCDIDKHPFLQGEWGYLEKIIEAGRSCFGICFGGQILAALLGAEVRSSPEPEIGGYEVWLTPEGAGDPLLAGFPETFPVFHWHGDTFDIPEGALHLVEGQQCRNQMFRHGNIIGVQFHIEVTVPQAARWTEEYVEDLPQIEKTASQVMDECRVGEPQMKELAYRLMDNYFDFIA